MVGAVTYLVAVLVVGGVAHEGVCPRSNQDGQHTKCPGILGGVVDSLRLNPADNYVRKIKLSKGTYVRSLELNKVAGCTPNSPCFCWPSDSFFPPSKLALHIRT